MAISTISESLFQLSSLLTDPICKAHELKTSVTMRYMPGEFNQCDNKVKEIARRSFLCLQLFFYAPLGSVLGAFALGLKKIAIALQENEFLHFKGSLEEKTLPEDGSISIYSLNCCFIGGGEPLKHGGIQSWPNRIDPLMERIEREDPDVLCLAEIYDLKAANTLMNKLENKYAHFYYNIGAQVIGANSGMFVASKYKIDDPKFCPFPNKTLLDEGKFVKKGLFSFSLTDQNNKVANINFTHLQHSQDDEHPKTTEIEARAKQTDFILDNIHKDLDPSIPTILTGDLNIGKKEYKSSQLDKHFYNNYFEDDQNIGTCIRDGFIDYVYEGRDIENPAEDYLDYCILLESDPLSNEKLEHGYTLKTSLVRSFDDLSKPDKALSDHHGLRTELRRSNKI